MRASGSLLLGLLALSAPLHAAPAAGEHGTPQRPEETAWVLGGVCFSVCFNPGVYESFLRRVAALVRFNPCLCRVIFEFCQALKAGQMLSVCCVPAAEAPLAFSNILLMLFLPVPSAGAPLALSTRRVQPGAAQPQQLVGPGAAGAGVFFFLGASRWGTEPAAAAVLGRCFSCLVGQKQLPWQSPGLPWAGPSQRQERDETLAGQGAPEGAVTRGAPATTALLWAFLHQNESRQLLEPERGKCCVHAHGCPLGCPAPCSWCAAGTLPATPRGCAASRGARVWKRGNSLRTIFFFLSLPLGNNGKLPKK